MKQATANWNLVAEELRKDAAVFSGILEIANEAIISVDENYRIILYNDGAERIFGYSAAEVIGQPLDILLPPKLAAVHRDHVARFSDSPETARLMGDRGEIVGVKKNGDQFPAEASISKLEVGDKRVFTAVLRDVTDRKLAEERLRKALTEVEELKNRLQAENLYLQEEIRLSCNFADIVGRSPALLAVLHRVEQVAATDATVLILGETGTGKELFARAVHSLSLRKERPLVRVDCAALSPTLIESELFGHEKGAFTGAFTRKVGRFELAHGGTVFLDEVGDLSPELQTKLLRILQEGEFERLGNPRPIKVDVRAIAATNRKLEKALQAGEFREDLYFRLNVFPIHVPPLRQRREDIPLLVRLFTQRFAKKLGKKIERIPRDAITSLQSYPWPGNVRELENVVERAVILSQSSTLRIEGLPRRPVTEDALVRPQGTLEEVEREYIVHTLKETGWRVEGKAGAAARLGLNPSTLRSRMRKLGIRIARTSGLPR